MLENKVKQRLQELIDAADKLRASARPGDFGLVFDSVSLTQWETSIQNLIESAFGRESSQLSYVVQATKRARYGSEGLVNELVGILRALLDDLKSGGIFKARQLIEAEVADDFLSQAEALLALRYKDPAAVLAGGVLEQHLRSLCTTHGVTIVGANGKPKMIDLMNTDLAKAGVYNSHRQKQVTAWADLRNKAAHGHYDQYSVDDVGDLVRDVRRFCAEVS